MGSISTETVRDLSQGFQHVYARVAAKAGFPRPDVAVTIFKDADKQACFNGTGLSLPASMSKLGLLERAYDFGGLAGVVLKYHKNLEFKRLVDEESFLSAEFLDRSTFLQQFAMTYTGLMATMYWSKRKVADDVAQHMQGEAECAPEPTPKQVGMWYGADLFTTHQDAKLPYVLSVSNKHDLDRFEFLHPLNFLPKLKVWGQSS